VGIAGHNPHILGAVLAGGRSGRFGSDKAHALLDGRPLIDHAIASLSAHVGAIIICGRSVPDKVCVMDRPAPDIGPLGGLNAALHHAAAHGYAGVLTLGCDMPVLPDDVANALMGDGPAVVEGQHLVGYWPSALADELERHLIENDDRAFRCWLDHARPRIIVPSGTPLPNINTVQDLEALAKRWPGV
jgi:molybdopterin-guanine dinucleotide biosynthesis protein A